MISGDMISIIGPNGSGKSTLIKLLSDEISPTSGNILFKNKENALWDLNDIAKLRSILPQSNHLSFPFSVCDIIKMGRYPFRGDDTSKYSQDVCDHLIEIFDLKKQKKQNYITLSGGEKQRVQLARVFAQIWSESDYSGKLLILDEPTSFLDIKHQCMLFDFLRKLNKSGLSILLVLHELNHAIVNSNKILMLKDGNKIEFGDIDKVVNEKNLEKIFDINIKLTKDITTNKQFVSYF